MPHLYNKVRPGGYRSDGYNDLPLNWITETGDSLNKNLADILVSRESIIDVVQSFPWTLTPISSFARENTPYIIIKEYLQLETQLNQMFKPYGKDDVDIDAVKLTSGLTGDFGSNPRVLKFLSSLAGYFKVLNEDTKSIYKGLFDHTTPTGFKYKLPFFTEEYFNINSNWEGTDVLDKIVEVQTQIGGAIKKGIVAIAGGKGDKFGAFLQSLPSLYRKVEVFNAQINNPSVGLMDPPHIFKGSSNRTYTVSFPLYNINATGTNSSELIVKNWELCYLLTYQNLVNKRNFFTGIPPAFYEVEIPGVHYCKASYISNLTIENLGNIRALNLPTGPKRELCPVNVPDAYSINITFTDLLQPSKNLLEAAIDSGLRGKITTNLI